MIVKDACEKCDDANDACLFHLTEVRDFLPFLVCPRGGIGRRAGFRFQSSKEGSGSTPVVGISFFKTFTKLLKNQNE